MFRPMGTAARAAAARAKPLVALCWLAACAPSAGFSDVRSLVKERVHADARWHAGGPQPKETRQQVDRLLAQPLSDTRAVQIAIYNNRELQAAFDGLGVARAELQIANLPPNPELEGHMGFSDDERPELGFALTANLTQLLFLPLRSDVAEAELEAERVRAAGMAIDLAFAVRGAFYDYQAAEQTLELWRTVLEAGEASYAFAERLSAAGNITRLDLENERAFREEARVGVDAAEVNAVNLREELNRLMGLSGAPAERWRLADKLADPDPDLPALAAIEHQALDRSLDLRELALRGKAEDSRADLATFSGVLPDLRAGVEVEREDHWKVGPVVALELPIFDHGQGETARAVARRDQLAHRRAAHAVAVRSAVRAAHKQLAVAIRTVKQYREVLLPMRARIVDETLRQYNAMQLGVFQLLAAKREQVQTGRAYVAALREYWQTRAVLDTVLAGRLQRPLPLTGGLGGDPELMDRGRAHDGGH